MTAHETLGKNAPLRRDHLRIPLPGGGSVKQQLHTQVRLLLVPRMEKHIRILQNRQPVGLLRFQLSGAALLWQRPGIGFEHRVHAGGQPADGACDFLPVCVIENAVLPLLSLHVRAHATHISPILRRKVLISPVFCLQSAFFRKIGTVRPVFPRAPGFPIRPAGRR